MNTMYLLYMSRSLDAILGSSDRAPGLRLPISILDF